MTARPAPDLRAATDVHGRAILTVAGACELAAVEMREIADRIAVGQPPRNLSALLMRYARCLDEAVRELRDPACLTPRRRARTL